MNAIGKAEGIVFAVVGLAVLYVIFKVAREGAAATGAAAGRAAVDAGAGVVLGVGDAIGLPRTDEDACSKAIREGRTWDASFVCPAGRFLTEALPASLPSFPSARAGTLSTGGASGSW